MASQYHTVAPDEDHERRAIDCWAETRRTHPQIYARALAALPDTERQRITQALTQRHTTKGVNTEPAPHG